jgi:hypothetical protein
MTTPQPMDQGRSTDDASEALVVTRETIRDLDAADPAEAGDVKGGMPVTTIITATIKGGATTDC